MAPAPAGVGVGVTGERRHLPRLAYFVSREVAAGRIAIMPDYSKVVLEQISQPNISDYHHTYPQQQQMSENGVYRNGKSMH
jgi:hypothetical protein